MAAHCPAGRTRQLRARARTPSGALDARAGWPSGGRVPCSCCPATLAAGRDRRRTAPGDARDAARPGSAGVASPRSSGGHDRPNVLVIMTDDARDDDLRFMPHVRHGSSATRACASPTRSPRSRCAARPARRSSPGSTPTTTSVWSHAPPYGFQALRRRADPAGVAARRRLRHDFLGKYLNGYGVPAAARRRVRRCATCLPGWTDWRGSVDGGVDGGAGPRRRHLPLLRHHAQRQRTARAAPGRLPDHAARRHRPATVIREQGALAAAVLPWDVVRRAAPRRVPAEADDPGRSLRSDGTAQVFAEPGAPAARLGPLRRADPRARRAPTGERTSPTSRSSSAACPRSSTAEQRGVREDARQRAEALSLVDARSRGRCATLRRTGRAGQHLRGVHLRQRLLPRRAPDAAGQDPALRAVAAGAADDPRPGHPRAARCAPTRSR